MLIVQDSREKKPWLFEGHDQIVECVDAGDYILNGDPYLITIDRKQKVTELASNLGAHIERFERELVRMQQYTHRYIICEFPYEKLAMYPVGSGLPRRVLRRIRVKGKYLVKQVDRLVDEYDVIFIFCNNRYEAQEEALELLVGVYKTSKVSKTSNKKI